MGTCNSNSRSSASGAGSTQSSANLKEQLVNGIADSDKKDFVFQLRMNGSIYDAADKAGNTQFINDFKKYDYVSINENLPKLEGTEKQIAYAESLRSRALNDQVNGVVKMFGNTDSVKRQRVDQMISQYRGNVKVDSFNDLVNVLVKENPNGAFKKLKSITSAKEIIEKYR